MNYIKCNSVLLYVRISHKGRSMLSPLDSSGWSFTITDTITVFTLGESSPIMCGPH